MRLRTATATAPAVAVAVLALVAAAPADGTAAFEAAVPDRQPTCGTPSASAFPLRTRISGGPAAYRPGGGFHTWTVELTNTTTEPCGNIHPVIVFTDRTRALKPGQIQLEFYESESRGEGNGGRQHPVTIERTDESELVGVLDDSAPGGPATPGSGGDRFRGFVVPPGRTVTVPVRLAFTSDARPDTITANAAIVQRRGGDGDWVGESADYRFALVDEEPASEFAEELPRTGRNVLMVAAASALAFLLGAGTLALAGRIRGRRG
ncbi:hypothetical protein [Streptomyces lavendofoliae]|uniref:Gram-positive cocci surface proteins LPxTG domain-containing protein n=1 Tax=Streptomyces lavendofoliae TaxID=67314 RepID=A0A918I492_9ACTN|nr:hypothetical protein [Streptomyces lavendofoliae]GGU64206.1 hypothetical protein GCM10010274_61170 [Streptomyces lavendofoliae]